MPNPPALTIGIRLNLITDEPDNPFNGQWRLRMWTKEASTEIPAEVFVWQEIPHVPYLDETAYVINAKGRIELFTNMASYADIFLYPANAPDNFSPFFRKRYLDICSEDKAILEETWKLGMAHLKHLTQEIYRLLNLPPSEVIEVEL